MKEAKRLVVTWSVGLPLFYLLWIVFVGSFSLHELLVGIVAALLAVIGLMVVSLRYPARFSPSAADLVSAWRIPWYLVSGTWEVLAVAARDFAGGKRAQSLFRTVSFDAGAKDDPHDTARRSLAVLFTTITPTTIVLGVNLRDKKLLFHEIERGRVSRMAMTLGARP